jgi:DNA-binding NarL/FixJ family response regulator
VVFDSTIWPAIAQGYPFGFRLFRTATYWMADSGLTPRPEPVVGGDDIKLVKSALDSFLLAAQRLAVEPNGSLVLVDAKSGVILMDIVMPNMDGPTATACIREDWPDVQVLALTSFVEEDLVQRAIGAGAIGYLLKEASVDELAEAIRAAHQGRSTLDFRALQLLVRTGERGTQNNRSCAVDGLGLGSPD